jgi:hypothetical protein
MTYNSSPNVNARIHLPGCYPPSCKNTTLIRSSDIEEVETQEVEFARQRSNVVKTIANPRNATAIKQRVIFVRIAKNCCNIVCCCNVVHLFFMLSSKC